jgi:hypothetical protein
LFAIKASMRRAQTSSELTALRYFKASFNQLGISDLFGVKALAFFVVICEAAGAAAKVAEVEDAGSGDLETGVFEVELIIVERDGSGRSSGINGAEVGEMGVGELGATEVASGGKETKGSVGIRLSFAGAGIWWGVIDVGEMGGLGVDGL